MGGRNVPKPDKRPLKRGSPPPDNQSVRTRIAIATSLALMLLGVAGAAPAFAHHPSVTEFQTGLTADGGPWGIVDGGDGRLWFTGDASNVFGPLSPGDGLIGEVTGKLLFGNPKGITRGPDGNLWIAESAVAGAIARVNADGSVSEFTTGLTGSPWDITSGPDGNLWFVTQSPATVGRITPGGTITQFSTGLTTGSLPSAITAGDDGNLWFTESADPGRIGRVTTDGVITENSIGLPPNMAPTDIVAGPEGNLWFTLAGDPGGIGRITPEGVFKIFDRHLTKNSRPTGLAVGTDGALWFTESASPGRIGRLAPDGDITEYTEGLTPDRAPWMITAGPDGNMWFTENANPGALARISLPPLARTESAGRVTPGSAVLGAKVRPNAQATEVHFEYGIGEAMRFESDSRSAGDGWDHTELTAKVDGLKPGHKYRFRVVATNDSGTTYGETGYFATPSLEPEHGETVVAEPTGRVRYKRPGGRWRMLSGTGAELPVGTSLDTRRGRIALTTAARNGKKQTGTFGGGVMQVRQPRRARGRVDIHLRGGNFAACGRARARSGSGTSASAAARHRHPVRRLWGHDKGGRFRTFGRHSQATVRGTRWLTKDTCSTTVTVVTQGAVVVRDFARHRNVLVTAGHRYVARKRARGARHRN
jgi:streptogramin lyase